MRVEVLRIQSYWIILVIIIVVCLIIPTRIKFMMNLINKKRKGEKRKMPTEMLEEFIGKECMVTIFNEIGAVQGKIIKVEENWIKVEEKKRIHIINGDMIKDISTSK